MTAISTSTSKQQRVSVVGTAECFSSGDLSSSPSSTCSLLTPTKRQRMKIVTLSSQCDETILEINPKRRFKRRNSKCPSMFRQMLSPANLVELQLEAAGEETRTTSRDDELLFPGDPLSTIKNKASQMPPITAAWCTFNLAGSLPQQKNATLSILTEALKLSSAHLDEMADSENSAEHNSE